MQTTATAEYLTQKSATLPRSDGHRIDTEIVIAELADSNRFSLPLLWFGSAKVQSLIVVLAEESEAFSGIAAEQPWIHSSIIGGMDAAGIPLEVYLLEYTQV